MEKLILVIMCIFFLMGGVDYILGNKFGLGEKFKEGIESIGLLVLSMTGIYAISPIIGKVLRNIFVPIGEKFGMDVSVFPSMFLAIDMGALGISSEISSSEEMYIVSGVIIASTLGATLSFSVPLALGLVKKESSSFLTKGMIYGIATMPIAPLFAGIYLGVDLKSLVVNLIPLFILTGILIVGILKYEHITQKIFSYFSRGILMISLIALMLMGINSILGVELIKGMIPINDALSVAGKIGIFLAGAYPFLEVITRFFGKIFSGIAKLLGVNNDSVISIFAGMISNIIIFQNFENLDDKGKIMCSAFSVSGAFVLGGQLGFVASEVPDYIGVYIISKLLAGVCAILMVILMSSKKKAYNNV